MRESTRAPDVEATATLDEVVRRRGDLYQAILALEKAAARPAVDREAEWLEGVLEALAELQGEIADHIELTERPGGLYTEILEAAPRLSGNVKRLRDEHPEMREAAEALRAHLADAEEISVEETRDEIQHVLGRLVKHRQHGADLLWEAYNLDTGGSD
jgi:DNA repair exonuclease SbcCD ATPase subunit